MTPLRYADGQDVRPGDLLGPGADIDGQTHRVVVVFDSREAVPGFDVDAWCCDNRRGVLVEIVNSSGKHLVHYSVLDDDTELLART